MKTAPVSARIDSKMLKLLDEKAERECRTRAGAVKEAIRKYLGVAK